MKLLTAIDEKRLGRVASTRAVADYIATAPDASFAPYGSDWQWRFEVRIASIQCGPQEAREELADRARRIIAREAFGEIENDIRTLQEMLWEEDTYIAANSPVLIQIQNMLSKVRGEER